MEELKAGDRIIVLNSLKAVIEEEGWDEDMLELLGNIYTICHINGEVIYLDKIPFILYKEYIKKV